jgi:hypothetical protein
MTKITEDEFRQLCDDLYRDRRQLRDYNPSATPAEAVLWVLLGSLYSLLSLEPGQVPAATTATVEGYVNTVCRVLDDRREGKFEPRPYLLELALRVDRMA